MEIVQTQMTVTDYCQAMDRKDIGVNRNYQRSDKVWPPAARSFLIETILLGFPIPKLSLHQVTDVRTRTTRKEIVDGQQRSMAIFDFFKNDLRLSRTLEVDDAVGKIYEELPSNLQAKFIDYGLSIDLFVSTSPQEVREVFRRINSYTIPLNAEEHRHAQFQGPFKWFIHRLIRDFGDAFLEMGLFSQKQLVRMNDAKLLTEIAYGLLYGISTTRKTILDQIYRNRDKEFPEENDLEERLRGAVDVLVSWPELHHTGIIKTHQVYALLLAIIHFRDPVEGLVSVVEPHGRHEIERDLVLSNLTALAEASESQNEKGEFAEFVRASLSKTNVGAQREVRFRWFYNALVGERFA